MESVLKRLECLELVGFDVAWEVLLGGVDVDWLTGVCGLVDLLSGAGDVDAGGGAQAAVEERDYGVTLVDGLFVDDLLGAPSESRDGVLLKRQLSRRGPRWALEGIM